MAVLAHALVDGLPWGAAFALGAVVSPTDPLAASQITQRLGVPRRTTTIMEVEALINGGSARVIYRTAVAAVGGAALERMRGMDAFRMRRLLQRAGRAARA